MRTLNDVSDVPVTVLKANIAGWNQALCHKTAGCVCWTGWSPFRAGAVSGFAPLVRALTSPGRCSPIQVRATQTLMAAVFCLGFHHTAKDSLISALHRCSIWVIKWSLSSVSILKTVHYAKVSSILPFALSSPHRALILKFALTV